MSFFTLGLSKSDTFGTVLDRNRGVGPGFDVLRIGLALMIFVGHARWVAGGTSLGVMVNTHMETNASVVVTAAPVVFSMTTPLKLALVPAFFALSGFLVTGSALRLRRTSTFFAHRVLRIFPALVVEVLLSAFFLGAALTTLPLGEYFTSPVFFRYLANMVGHVSFVLPGLFEHNAATQAVNVNVWTLPAELYCYIICMALMLSGVMYNKKLVTISLVVITIVLATLDALYNISFRTPYPLHVIVYYFLLGCGAYHWRDRISCRPAYAIPVAVLVYILLSHTRFTYLAAPLLTWLTMFVGMIGFPKSKVLASGDYSYGIYLYGFPLCQGLVTAVPWFYGRSWLFVAATTLLTAIFAAFSWHVVEKKVLRLKRKLPERWFPTTPRERVSVEV